MRSEGPRPATKEVGGIMTVVQGTRWTDWLSLLAGLAAALLAVLILFMLAMGICFRLSDIGPFREIRVFRALFLASNPSLLLQTITFLLPLPAIAAVLGGLGLLLVRRREGSVGRLTVAEMAARYGRVGLLVGGGSSVLILSIAVILTGLRWCLWG
jgi:hypothetical protein